MTLPRHHRRPDDHLAQAEAARRDHEDRERAVRQVYATPDASARLIALCLIVGFAAGVIVATLGGVPR